MFISFLLDNSYINPAETHVQTNMKTDRALSRPVIRSIHVTLTVAIYGDGVESADPIFSDFVKKEKWIVSS